MNYDYAVHSDFLIHWTGRDIDEDAKWYESDKSVTADTQVAKYLERLYSILKYGLWMTIETDFIGFKDKDIPVPSVPKTCFTELKLSQSRQHARRYGRLGIGVKRPFVFSRFGRPVIYYGFHRVRSNDKFLQQAVSAFTDKALLNFFKPMNSTNILNYDFYSESEWRIVFFQELLDRKLVIDPRNPENVEHHQYFLSLSSNEQEKLLYLVPLCGWFAMLIYPSIKVKNKAQQDLASGIREQIRRIKGLPDHGNGVENGNWPIELDLDACRHF